MRLFVFSCHLTVLFAKTRSSQFPSLSCIRSFLARWSAEGSSSPQSQNVFDELPSFSLVVAILTTLVQAVQALLTLVCIRSNIFPSLPLTWEL